MNKEKIEKILDMLKPLAEISKDKPTAQRLYFTAQVLSDYDENDVQQAIIQIARMTQFFPAPCEIIAEFTHDAKDEAENWWGIILKQVKERGFYAGAPTNLSYSAKRAMENIGGWDGLCAMETEKLPIYAKQFRDAYRAFSKIDRVDDLKIESAETRALLYGIGEDIE